MNATASTAGVEEPPDRPPAEWPPGVEAQSPPIRSSTKVAEDTDQRRAGPRSRPITGQSILWHAGAEGAAQRSSGDWLLAALFEIGDASGAAAILAAVCERSGLVVALRDDDGCYIYSNELLTNQVGGLDLRGRSRAGVTRYFDESGRELAFLEHPAQRVRRTGTAETNVRMWVGESFETARHIQASYVPLTQGAAGWRVLSIGSDLTESA